MSKKKAFSGNTMTLKDFHGGSIPTDLPLPSAPGVMVRPADRPGFDRSSSWGNPMGRPDLRPRPSSSPAARHLDDKAPFLTHAVHIGRNFDEDERKPLDGGSAPRRMVSDDSFAVLAKPVVVSTGGASAQYGLVTGASNSYSARVAESTSVSARSQNSVGSNLPAVSGSASTNVWAAKKEFGVVAASPVHSIWSEQDAVSKLAHASAIEKVSSGRWQSKLSVGYQRDTESSRYLETENRLRLKGYDENTQTRTDMVGDRECVDAALSRQTERSMNVEDGVQSGKELQDFEANIAPNSFDGKERKSAVFGGGQPIHLDEKFGGSEMQQAGQLAASERPKLKLLPRSKPLDIGELVVDKQAGHQWLRDSAPGHAENVSVSHGSAVSLKPGLTGSESVNPPVERPKLNLKPRSNPSEQPEGSEKERTALFGGARPRELVLKERGIDHASPGNHEQGQHHDGQRVNHSVSRADKISDQATPSRLGERIENIPFDQRSVRRPERNHRVEAEKVDTQRKNWRNENRRNGRENERQQLEQQERQQSPETWRKPVEPPKPASPDTGGLRYGKVTSAMELAQAFSKSHSSDPKADDQYSGQRMLPGRPQVPFSRLTSTAPRAQINGY